MVSGQQSFSRPLALQERASGKGSMNVAGGKCDPGKGWGDCRFGGVHEPESVSAQAQFPKALAWVVPLIGADFSLPTQYGTKEPEGAGPKALVLAAPGRRWWVPISGFVLRRTPALHGVC